MLGLSLKDEIRDEVIRHRTKVIEIVGKIRKLKWRWAGLTSNEEPSIDWDNDFLSGDHDNGV